jgi:dihydrofolate synthase/folylpolyglutamate synthase
MIYNETIAYLYNLQKHGTKFGLDNIRRLSSALGDPQKSFLTIHIAGTNGKGSTSAITASILKTAGLRVGLFTSPHLISFTERIRINGKEITETDIISLAGEIRETVLRMDDFSPTFFEVVTAMALLYFKREKVDLAVMEAGMGGRLDATNIIMPEVSVITNISYDHRELLGNTLTEIAREKAGIIRSGVPVVSSGQEQDALEQIMTAARERGSDLYLYGRDFAGELTRGDISEIQFNYADRESFRIDKLILPLAGEHQVQNASVAIKAARLFLKQSHTSQLVSSVREGLKTVTWPGRLEFVKVNPPILIDGAHNPAAAEVLAQTIRKNFLERFPGIILILGIMGDKDIRGIMEPLLPLASEAILTAPSYSRAASPEALADIAASLGCSHVHTVPNIQEAVEIAIRDSSQLNVAGSKSPLIVITGSFYTIGEAKEVLGQKGVLTTLRE